MKSTQKYKHLVYISQHMTNHFQIISLNTFFFKVWIYIVVVELAHIQMPDSGWGSRCYLNLAKYFSQWFPVYLHDKEVPNIGAITEHTNTKRRLKNLLLHLDKCVATGRLNWHLHCYLVSRVTSNQRLSGPKAPSLTLLQQFLSTQPAFMSNIYMSYLGLCELHASKPVEKWHSC